MEEEATTTLFLGNLDPKVTRQILYEVGIQAGPVKAVTLPMEGSRNKGYGFVEYETVESASYAVSLFRGTLRLFDRQVRISFGGQKGGGQRGGASTAGGSAARTSITPSRTPAAAVSGGGGGSGSNGPAMANGGTPVTGHDEPREQHAQQPHAGLGAAATQQGAAQPYGGTSQLQLQQQQQLLQQQQQFMQTYSNVMLQQQQVAAAAAQQQAASGLTYGGASVGAPGGPSPMQQHYTSPAGYGYSMQAMPGQMQQMAALQQHYYVQQQQALQQHPQWQ